MKENVRYEDTGWRRPIGYLIFIGQICKSDVYLVALLWKMICNLSLGHLVSVICVLICVHTHAHTHTHIHTHDVDKGPSCLNRKFFKQSLLAIQTTSRYTYMWHWRPPASSLRRQSVRWCPTSPTLSPHPHAHQTGIELGRAKHESPVTCTPDWISSKHPVHTSL